MLEFETNNDKSLLDVAMKKFKLSIFILSFLFLPGCFWGLMGGTIEIHNDTDDGIRVRVDQNEINDGNYYPDNMALAEGDWERFGLRLMTFTPVVHVEYKGHDRIYPATLDFLGFDRIYVNTDDFPKSSNKQGIA